MEEDCVSSLPYNWLNIATRRAESHFSVDSSAAAESSSSLDSPAAEEDDDANPAADSNDPVNADKTRVKCDESSIGYALKPYIYFFLMISE